MAASYTQPQVMMTLAALAATAATERPSGETLAEHQQRILKGINEQLGMPNLATDNQWTAVWIGLTRNRANLAYLAMTPNSGSPQYALCLRGTIGASPIDTSEDMEVGLMLPFTAGGTPPKGPVGNISQGAMEAFTDIVMGTTLLQALAEIEPGTLYVVGHSLGGALVTTVSLYLANSLRSPAQIQPFTFAAPTAGDVNFATWFNQQFPGAQCFYNYYDLVPNAWAGLTALVSDHKDNPFYPKGGNTAWPGPTATPTNAIGQIIKAIAKNTNSNSYVQPTQQKALNNPAALFLGLYPAGAATEIDQFEVQVSYQHANDTYLSLLGAPPLPTTAPAVASISPTSGPAGTTVTITPAPGVVFSADSVVDFGIVSAAAVTIADDGSSIAAVAPAGIGTVDVRVTNIFGTSPAVPVYPNLTFDSHNDQFTFVTAG